VNSTGLTVLDSWDQPPDTDVEREDRPSGGLSLWCCCDWDSVEVVMVFLP